MMSSTFIDNVHAENVLQRMWEQCESEQLCDVTLVAGNDQKKVSAHRSILCASSEYFKAMFMMPLCESAAKEVKMTDVDGEILKSLIKFCYTGRLEITEDIVENLLKAADALLLEVVVNACGNFLGERLHSSNCLGFALLAERHRCQSLSKRAKEYTLEHFMELSQTDEFLELNVDQLYDLLSSQNIRISSEEDVFDSLQLWIQKDPSERAKYKDKLLKAMQMSLLEASFLIDHIKPICDSAESFRLYVEAMEWHSLSVRQALTESELTKLKRSNLNPSDSTSSMRSNLHLMAIEQKLNNAMKILYYCQKQQQWVSCFEDLATTYRYEYDVASMEDKIFVAGGRNPWNNVLNSVLCLNLKTMQRQEVQPMIESRQFFGVAVLKGFLYVVGGVNEGTISNFVERWDPKTNAWNEVACMSVSRCSFGIAVLNDKLYVVGGSRSCSFCNLAECYDPCKNVWTPVASMIESRQSHGVAAANGFLYAVGGLGSKTVEKYDPKTDKWTMICSLKEPFYKRPSCTTFRDKVMVLYDDRVEIYNPITNEWKLSASIKGSVDIHRIFSYSGALLVTRETKNKLAKANIYPFFVRSVKSNLSK